MNRDGKASEETMKATNKKAGSVLVGLVVVTMFVLMLFGPFLGQHLKTEVKRTASEKAYLDEMQTVLRAYQVHNAEIELTEDMNCEPNIRYYNVAINSAVIEGMSNDEKYKMLIALGSVKLKPAEDEVFIVITRPFLVTTEANYRISKSMGDDKLEIVDCNALQNKIE